MSPTSNLPQRLSSFIGREREIAEVERQLGLTRMLTLMGPGGAGKTRLSLKIAVTVLERYPDGVWFVELATLTNPELVPQAVASVLDIREERGRELTPTLAEYLKPRKLLLILDNCEHMTPACASLADALLHACPHLTILATSRAALNIAGELSWQVPPLSLPDPRERVPVEHLRQYEAIQLFVERAERIRHDFALTPENGQTVADLCRRLDGLPLAIELAAARVRALSVKQILELLDQRFKLLTYNVQDSEPHQQTLKALIDWSYDLLPDDEKALLRKMSVFIGSFTLEALKAVCEGWKDDFQVLDLLTLLAEKSLIVVDEHEGEALYRLLETIRQYALAKLAESGEASLLSDKHRDWYVSFAESASEGLSAEGSKPWLDRLELEHDNIRAALEWSTTGEGRNTEAALRLVGAMWRFWDTRGYIDEGQKWMTAALNVSGSSPALVRAKALNAAGNLALQQGDYSRAEELHQGGLILRKQMGDLPGSARSLINMGVAARRRGEYEKAARLIEEGLKIARELGNQDVVATALSNLGYVIQCQGDYERAIELHNDALAIFWELGRLPWVVISLNNLGEAAQSQGNYEQARIYFEDALAKAKELADKLSIAGVKKNLGCLENQQGNHKRAAELYRESLGVYHEQGDKQGIAQCLEGLASAEGRDHQERVMKLFGAAEALREKIGYPLPFSERSQYDQDVARARAGLREGIANAAWEAGRKMSLDEIIRLAMEWLIMPSRDTGTKKALTKDKNYKLTNREIQVLREVDANLAYGEIARKLGVDVRTVHAHMQSIRTKLHVTNRRAAAEFAREHGLI